MVRAVWEAQEMLCSKNPSVVESSADQGHIAVTTTRRRRDIRKPAQFMTISCNRDGYLKMKGEVVRTKRERGSCRTMVFNPHITI